MRDSVNSIWIPFNYLLEGRLPFMYLDTRNFVTTGMGNLIEPRSTAEALLWYDQNTGDTASIDEIDDAWDLVKSRTDLSPLGGGAFTNVTSLRLTDSAIDDLIFSKLLEMEKYLERRPHFRDFQNWPADAQLGLLSMSWGMGPAFNFPRFQAYASDRRWAEAATECRFNPDVGTIKIKTTAINSCSRTPRWWKSWGSTQASCCGRREHHRRRKSSVYVPTSRPHTTAEASIDVRADRCRNAVLGGSCPDSRADTVARTKGGHQGPNWYIQYGMDLSA